MSLSSKTYINLTEKSIGIAKKKYYARKEVEDSQSIFDVSRYELQETRGNVQNALEALRKAEQALIAAREEEVTAFEEYQKASKRLNKDKKNYSKLIDEEFDIIRKMEGLELEEKNKVIAKNKDDEKRVILAEKKKNKNYLSEGILKKLSTLPDEIKRIVCGFLPFNVRVNLLDDKFKSIITRYHNAKSLPSSNMLTAFLDYIATQPEFLGVLTRKEARHQIPSLTPRGFKWRHYSYDGLVNYPKLLYNKIIWATEMATSSNPKFAYKIMKTVIVFGNIEGKYKISSTVKAKNYLTIEDLPREYR